jgi:HAMP domain-containing protein
MPLCAAAAAAKIIDAMSALRVALPNGCMLFMAFLLLGRVRG